MKAEAIISLSERLRRHSSAKLMETDLAVDLRLASKYLRRFASLLIAEEANVERDPVRQRQLMDEAIDLWQHAEASH